MKTSSTVATPGRIETYYRLTKPGIIRGNLLTATAGFFLAASGHISIEKLVALLVGMALVIACGCVSNNVLDRGIDERMKRTARRALVTGAVSIRAALIYAAVLVVAGTFVLAYWTNLLTAVLGLTGLFMYVIVYGIAKRTTVQSTIIGSISGAIPPVGGYAAASGRLDIGALLLFVILTCWQMPHFYALAIYRRSEYAAAGLPILSVIYGIRRTSQHIIGYTIAFSLAAVALAISGNAGWVYLAGAAPASAYWLSLAFAGRRVMSDEAAEQWARRMFGRSLLVLSIWCAAVIIDSFIHISIAR